MKRRELHKDRAVIVDSPEGVNVLIFTSYFRIAGNVSDSRKPAGLLLTSSVMRFQKASL